MFIKGLRGLNFALLLLAFALLFGLPAGVFGHVAKAGPPPTDTRIAPVQRDVTYCTAGGVEIKLDLYRQQDSGGIPAPAVMFVHGGSWQSGDKAGSEGVPEINDLVSRGYLVASINYRLAPRYVFPAQINDVKCAVRYLRANAAYLNINPRKIGAWGASAGGHLVSLLGTTDSSAGMEGDSGSGTPGGQLAISSRVQAVVDMYGRADLTTVPQMRPDLLPIFGSSELARYSPVTYVSRDDPPFLILHGDMDSTVPWELSQAFYTRLKAAGVPATFVTVTNAEHGFVATRGAMTPSRTEITHIVGEFFDRYLKDASAATVASQTTLKAEPLPSGGEVSRCEATGKTVRGKFLDYWHTHGYVAQQGYPISSEMDVVSAVDGKPYTMQYFERAVLEYHPENAAPYDVLPSLLGIAHYKEKYPGSRGAPGQRPNTTEGSVLVPQTGHRVGGVFLQYWQEHGGVAQQGYPMSDELTEKSELDGKEYTVQYFERAVFEWHPEYKDTPNEVLLSQLGRMELRHK